MVSFSLILFFTVRFPRQEDGSGAEPAPLQACSLWAQGPVRGGWSQGLCADGGESVFCGRSEPNPEPGWGSVWAWVESFVTGLRPSL